MKSRGFIDFLIFGVKLKKKDILALVLEVFAENPKKSRRNL